MVGSRGGGVSVRGESLMRVLGVFSFLLNFEGRAVGRMQVRQTKAVCLTGLTLSIIIKTVIIANECMGKHRQLTS